MDLAGPRAHQDSGSHWALFPPGKGSRSVASSHSGLPPIGVLLLGVPGWAALGWGHFACLGPCLGLCSSGCSPTCLLELLRSPPRVTVDPQPHAPAVVTCLPSRSGSCLRASAVLEAAWSFVPAFLSQVVATPGQGTPSGWSPGLQDSHTGQSGL